MTTVIEWATRIILLCTVILQCILLVYLFYINHRRYKEDLKFWKKQDETSDALLKSIRGQVSVQLKSPKEDTNDEQDSNKE